MCSFRSTNIQTTNPACPFEQNLQCCINTASFPVFHSTLCTAVLKDELNLPDSKQLSACFHSDKNSTTHKILLPKLRNVGLNPYLDFGKVKMNCSGKVALKMLFALFLLSFPV